MPGGGGLIPGGGIPIGAPRPGGIPIGGPIGGRMPGGGPIIPAEHNFFFFFFKTIRLQPKSQEPDTRKSGGLTEVVFKMAY